MTLGLNLTRMIDWHGRYFNGNYDQRPTVKDSAYLKTHPPVEDDGIWYLPMIQYLQSLSPSAIRLMDAQWINGSPLMRWANRSRPFEFQGDKAKGGLCYEWALNLADTVGAVPWLCLPALADENFIYSFCYLLGEWKKPFIFQYSNELWNQGKDFPQSELAKFEGKKFPRPHQHAKGAASLEAKVAQQVKSLLGNQATIVLGGWSNSPRFNEAMLEHLALSDGLKYFDALTVAPYFGSKVHPSEPLDKAKTLALLDKGIEELMAKIAQNKAIASKYGLRLLGYEGGQHLVSRRTKLHLPVNRWEEMADFYQKFLEGWHSINDDLLCLFNSGPLEYSEHGAWGLIEQLGEDSPKLRGVKAFIQANSP